MQFNTKWGAGAQKQQKDNVEQKPNTVLFLAMCWPLTFYPVQAYQVAPSPEPGLNLDSTCPFQLSLSPSRFISLNLPLCLTPALPCLFIFVGLNFRPTASFHPSPFCIGLCCLALALALKQCDNVLPLSLFHLLSHKLSLSILSQTSFPTTSPRFSHSSPLSLDIEILREDHYQLR